MCLISLSSIPTIAEEDITVYKVLGKFYHAPYLKYQKTDENRYGEVRYDYYPGLNEAKGPEDIQMIWKCNEECKYMIGSGYLHSYATKDNAMIGCQEMFQRANMPYYVYEMKIPKGASYFRSINDDEYCSDTLIFENTEPVYKEEPVKTIDVF